MNKKIVVIAALVVILFTVAGCAKSTPDTNNCVANNTGVPTAAEIASVKSYLDSKAITATQDPGGFFYIITAPGAGATPTLSSKVTVKYTGSLESGSVFDQSQTGTTFTLSQLILGWQKGIPLIKKGGTIKLFLPPSLGYGCNAVGSIPPGSNLIFTIDLVDVQ